MEKDSRVRGIWGTMAKPLLRRERGSRQHPSYQPHLPRGSERGCNSTVAPRTGSGRPGAEWRERRTEASGQQREPGPRPGTRTRWERGGLAVARRRPAQPAARAGAARPRSSARCPSHAAAPGEQLPPSPGRPTFGPRLQSRLTRLRRPCPARPTERTAPFTLHCSVLLFSRVFVVSSRSRAKSENLRWSPRAGRAKPGRRGRGAGGVGAPPGTGALSRSQGPPQALYNIDAHVK